MLPYLLIHSEQPCHVSTNSFIAITLILQYVPKYCILYCIVYVVSVDHSSWSLGKLELRAR